MRPSSIRKVTVRQKKPNKAKTNEKSSKTAADERESEQPYGHVETAVSGIKNGHQSNIKVSTFNKLRTKKKEKPSGVVKRKRNKKK